MLLGACHSKCSCPVTISSYCFWLYSLWCTSIPVTDVFYSLQLLFPYPLHLFIYPLRYGSQQSLVNIYGSVSCLFFLDSTYKWIYMAFVFLYLAYFTYLRLFMSIHLSQMARLTSFFMANIPLCICSTTSLSIHLLFVTWVASISLLL